MKTELDVCIDRITRSHRKADLTEMKYWAYKLIEHINVVNKEIERNVSS